MDLKEKVVVVTGSAGGLGRAMIQAFRARGSHCVVTDLDAAAVEQTVADLSRETGSGRMEGIPCNVTDEGSVEHLFQETVRRLGRLDVAVLNAGILRDGLMLRVDRETGKVKSKLSLEQWQSVIDVNLTGVFLSAREASAQMVNLGNGGVLIPISSVARHGNPGQTNYSAAKAGVAAMTRVWTDELARFHIRVAAIAPGFIATEMVLAKMNQEARAAWEAKIPIGRLGRPDEIAHTAVYIAENDLVNGVVIEPSGGVRI